MFVAVSEAMEVPEVSSRRHCVWSTLAKEAWALHIPESSDPGDIGTPTTIDSSPLPVMEERCGHTHEPRHIDLLQLNELNWNDLSRHQEWRTTLHLRNLTWKLCDEGTLQSFLEKSGLMGSIAKIRVKPGGAQRSGSATLRVTQVEEVGKVARFFHGRQFPGARSPVAVSFAETYHRAPEPHKVPQPTWGLCNDAAERLTIGNVNRFDDAAWCAPIGVPLTWTRENIKA